MSGRAPISFSVLLAILLGGPVVLGQAKPRPASPLAQAKAQLAQHDLKSAEDSIWKVLSADPNNAEALLLLGVVRGEQQRFPEAETLFQRAVQVDPSSVSAHIYLGKTYLTENKLAEATGQYQQARQLAPRNVEVNVTLAKLYAADGKFQAALDALNSVPAARLPAEAIPIRVGSLLALGQQAKATQIAGSVKDPATGLALAEVFAASKLPDQALKMLDSAAASGRRPPARFYFVKGKALDATGKPALALQNYQK
ncbi:MAG TPA: tetratricopeptide repeat protein, partial [Terriglobales bacterium]|nr:tetratricopeptide repeat protein [Terriglobales bacterium]